MAADMLPSDATLALTSGSRALYRFAAAGLSLSVTAAGVPVNADHGKTQRKFKFLIISLVHYYKRRITHISQVL